MKKQLLPGVALGCSLLFSGVVRATPIRDTADPTALPTAELSSSATQTEKSDPTPPDGPYRERFANPDTPDMGARWSWTERNSQTTWMAFTSTFAADQAARQMGNGAGSLSFAGFGRVPFYQTLSVSTDVTTKSFTQPSSTPVASLPEPATLTLLGAGLAALAAGLRKKNKKSGK